MLKGKAKGGKLYFSKGFTDAYPGVVAKVSGHLSVETGAKGTEFTFSSYEQARAEAERLCDALGEGYTRGVYASNA